LLAPAAFAQAPAPKVTINGLFDQITSTGRNLYDGDFTRSNESEWYARTRFRPDFTFEVGRTKAVLGLEIDLTYGNPTGKSSGGMTLNTDVAGVLEVKWIYTEFDLTGKDSLMPFIPVATRARAGGQPFGTLANYKPTYANGDFPGISAVTTFAPNLRTNVAYVQIEEELATTERSGSLPFVAGTGIGRATSGDDFAFIFSPEITPFKGLDIKPLYSYFHAEGATNANARRTVFYQSGTGVFTTNAPITVTGIGTAPGGAAPGTFQSTQLHEDRHTIGLDTRFRSGPFSLDPTVMFQWGDREQVAGGIRREADMRSWLVDITGGWQLGPLLLEARYMYSPGNKASDDLSREIRYYEPLDLDTGYWAGWASIFALGTDYYNGGGGTVGFMPTNVGYDRYGRHGFGVRATYALTPSLAMYVVVSPTWTDEKVDTDAFIVGARRLPLLVEQKGDSRYLGTEADIGTTWRFAPNTAFDLSGAYLFAGSALDAPNVGKSNAAGAIVKDDAEDAWTIAARVRLSF